MVYAYRLKDRDSKETGRVVEGFTVRRTWQFTSDPKAAALKKWAKVLAVEAEDITSVKKAADTCDKEQKGMTGGPQPESGNTSAQSIAAEASMPDLNDPLAGELEGKTLNDLKGYAKAHGFDEAEYSKLTRSKLVDYIVLGMREKENA
jgi:hypothetical protein